MSRHKRFHSPSVGALVTAMAASLQGIDRLPPEERSSRTALALLDFVLRRMNAETPELRPSDLRELQMLRTQLQEAVEGLPMWAGQVSPSDVIH